MIRTFKCFNVLYKINTHKDPHKYEEKGEKKDKFPITRNQNEGGPFQASRVVSNQPNQQVEEPLQLYEGM